MSTKVREPPLPQIDVDDISFGILEPDSGALLARRAVQAVLEDAIRQGVQYVIDAVVAPKCANGNLKCVRTVNGGSVSGGNFVFCCGAWLPQLFPDVLGSRIFPTRQAFSFRPRPLWKLVLYATA